MNWWRDKEVFSEGYLDSVQDVRKRSKLLKSRETFPQNLSHEKRMKFYDLWVAELKSYGLSAVEEQIQKIKDAEAFIVTTGQQAVIGGGPLLVFYKALSAIEYAQTLSTEETPVYPLFWIAGDDSDFEEVNQFEILSEDKSFSFSQVERHPESPVGHYHLTKDNVNEWKTFVKATQLKDSLKSELIEYFKVGDSLVQSMGKWLAKLFQSTPLLIIDGGGAAVRSCESQLLSSVYSENDKIQQELKIQSSHLKGLGVKTQVPLDEEKVRLFELRDGQRHRIYSSDRLNKIDETEVVHDALSRPFLLEKLFPILGHVLGPAELKYFALIQSCFDVLNCRPPLVIKRFNCTILTQSQTEVLSSLEVDQSQISQLTYSQLTRYFVQSKYSGVVKEVNEFQWEVPSLQTDLISDEDKLSLQQSMESSLRMLEQKWANKVQKKLQQNDEDLKAKSKKLSRWLGSARVQERHMTWWEASNSVSLKDMTSIADLTSESHQVLTLSEVFK